MEILKHLLKAAVTPAEAKEAAKAAVSLANSCFPLYIQ
jgi:hypothetical protein